MATGLLGKYGVHVTVVDNGEKAVQQLSSRPDAFDVVLMDVQMPVMDGFTATRLIRQQLGLALPIIAMSAGVLDSEVGQCLAAGMNDFIAKPIDVDQMVAAISRHLPSPERSSELMHMSAHLDGSGVFDGGALLRVSDNTDYRRGLLVQIRATVDQSAVQMDDARAAIIDCRYGDAAGIFHAMRGAVGALGAQRFVMATREIEAALLAEHLLQIPACLAQVGRELEATSSAARTWLQMHEDDCVQSPQR